MSTAGSVAGYGQARSQGSGDDHFRWRPGIDQCH
jgi:hypothetical protein